MKLTTILSTLTALTIVSGAFAQGTVNYSSRATGVTAPVYGLDASNPNLQLQGPDSSVAYTGAKVGSGVTAELWYGPLGSTDNAVMSLVPGSSLPFRASPSLFLGTVSGGEIVVPGTSVGGAVALQLRAYDNMGGSITSWEQAQANPAIAVGWSTIFDITGLGGPGNPPTTPPNLVGLESFNLFIVPEPSTIALGVLGLGALLVFRRRK